MQLNKEENTQPFQIKAYEPGAITVNETCYHDSIIVCAKQLIAPWRPKSLGNIREDDWQPILALQPDIVLLGTGETFMMAEPAVLASLINAQIGVECMDTRAACRHFIALSADGRKVVAALLIE